jgi:hypothetical protein
MFKTNQDRKKIKRSATVGKSVTEQSHKKGCDINHLVNTYAKAGGLPEVDPSFFQNALPVDFHTAMNLVTEAQQKFDDLPSDIRNRFNHDPAVMMEFFEQGGQMVGDEFMTAEEFTTYTEAQKASEATGEAGTESTAETPPPA